MKIQGFSGEPKQPIGMIDLVVELGEGKKKAVLKKNFVLADETSAYNAFLGRPALADFRIALAPWCDEISHGERCGKRRLEYCPGMLYHRTEGS